MAIAPAGRGIEILSVYSLFLVLTTITVALRVYCRVHIQKAFGWDDWFATLSWVLFVLHASFAITGIHHGTGQHAWNIQPTEIPIGLKNWWLCEPLYVLSNMALKASIALMLLRLSVRSIHKHVLWITLVITEIYSAFFFFFLFVFQCIPSQYFWTRFTDGQGTCLDTSIVVAATYGYSAITCVGDLVFSILPVLLVWSLQMGRKEKAAVIAILSMGAIASIATIVRIPYVHTLGSQDDFLYATSDIAIWSCSETGLGLTAGCAAVLRPLFREVLASSRFLSSGAISRRHTLPSNGGAPTHTMESRRGYKRSSSSGWGEEEVTLQTLKTHGQKPGKDGKGFGTTTCVYYQEEEEIGGSFEGTGPLDGEGIVMTMTRDVTLT